MAVVSMSYLLEAGVHFGHQRRRWNPKMKEYIYTSRDDIYIIDLQKTSKLIEEAYEALKQIVEQGGTVLFVGTKKQAAEVIAEEVDFIESKNKQNNEAILNSPTPINKNDDDTSDFICNGDDLPF